MKKYIVTQLVLIICCTTSAKDYRAKLSDYYSFDCVAISPSEDLFYGIMKGDLYKAKGFDKLWHSVLIKEAPISEFSTNTDFKNVYFLTNDIIVIFSVEFEEGTQICYLYKSVNRGETWRKTKLAEGDWIRNIFIDNQKSIWVGLSHADLFRSNDMGNTWSKVEYPTILQNQRIYLSGNDKSLFIVGDDGKIYITTESLSNLVAINSPLTENKNSTYHVNKFEQLGSYYIACQNKQVFYTKTDNINWKIIDNASDFVLDGQSKAFLLNEDLSISSINSLMETEWTSNDKIEYPNDLYAINNNLYLFYQRYLNKINKNSFRTEAIYTDEQNIKPTDLKIKWKGEDICFDDGDVLRFDKGKNQLYRYMNLPIDFNHVAVYNNKILLTDYEIKNHYLFDLENKTYEKLTLPDKLVDLSKKRLKAFRIEKSASGCFHYDQWIEDYKYEKDVFVKQAIEKDTSRFTQPKSLSLSTNKNAQRIKNILNEINKTSNEILSIKDINLTQKDIDAYKTYLKQKKNELIKYQKEIGTEDNDPDLELDVPVEMGGNLENYYLRVPNDLKVYEQYEILADSILTLPDSIINQIFEVSDLFSSTDSDWIKITINFDDNTSISVFSGDSEHNFLFTPWTIDYEGLKVKSNSLKIGRLINKIGEGKIMHPIFSDKRYAIHQIVNYLYDKKQKDGSLDKLVYSAPQPQTKDYTIGIVIVSLVVIFLLFLICFRDKE